MHNGPVLIGMVRSKGSPGNVATAMAMAARAMDADLVFFRPEDVELATATIRAKRFAGDRWRDVTSRFPDVLENDDACLAPRYAEVWKALRAAAPQTTFRLGGKMEMAKRLASLAEVRALTIPYSLTSDDAGLEAFLREHRKIVLKPALGSQGRSVWVVALTNDHNGKEIITAATGGSPGFTSRPGRSGILHRITGNKAFIAQKYVSSNLPSGAPFDIRLHVRRDHRAQWTPIKFYARIGAPGTIISNLSAGGSIGELEPTLRQRYADGAERVCARLRDLARELPPVIQTAYPEFMIDALGLDIGLDEDGAPWLFEVNSFPGARYFETSDAIPRIGYCLYKVRRARA